MPDQRKHRGPHPGDQKLFAPAELLRLREAVAELSWLLTRAYTMKAALKLVGDKFRLTERQRLAVSRAACSDQSKTQRVATSVAVEVLHGAPVIVDGFNLIITIEAALSGGVLLLCRDGCIRDLSSVHGSYRSVTETDQALELIGETFASVAVESAAWILDQPISNSGRLAQRMRRLASAHGWNWTVDLAFNPDAEIIAAKRIIISSDGPLLDRAEMWVNFARHMIEKRVAESWVVDLS